MALPVPSYGKPPVAIGHFAFDLPEVMYYLYLPVRMGGDVRLPPNVECCRPLINHVLGSVGKRLLRLAMLQLANLAALSAAVGRRA